ncbi:methyl-accepting chemotaxis protein [Agrobacterium sp. ES01]|uniref:methyl-accepting chemotaxis protein n=1 Tax=Agrobacterium sp. ES01 TaxID=3420714 RepID=UPI003D126CE9
MSFIDRLLQSRRIVTKVLLFIVPLVVLMAGVGLLGYYTSHMLNGHMTMTRATIGNIADFDNLQSALQDYTAEPTEDMAANLEAAIARQADGAKTLEQLLVNDGDRAKLTLVLGLEPVMRRAEADLVAIDANRTALNAAISADMAALVVAGQGAQKQIDIIQKDFSDKEAFAKGLLYDAAAFKGLSERLEKLLKAMDGALTDSDRLKTIKNYGGPLSKELDSAEGMVSEKGAKQIEPVKKAATELADLGAETVSPLARETRFEALKASLPKVAETLANKAIKNSNTAAERFVKLDADVLPQRQLVGQVDAALQIMNTMGLHAARMQNLLDDASRESVLSDISALTANIEKIAELGQKNSTMRDLPGVAGPLLAQMTDDSATLLAADGQWTQTRQAAFAELTRAAASLHDFVRQAQEVGKADSDRSAVISVVAMVVGTLMAIIGGLMLIETLRAPMKRITEVMSRLANGDLSVPIEGRERGDEIGDMVRSVTVFRDAAVENVRLEEEASRSRDQAGMEEERRAAERARIEDEQRQALAALDDVLRALATGNLEATMRGDLPSDFQDMARIYNQAVETLRVTLADVRGTAADINAGTGNLAVSADDLARRTEQQAAAIEESSRALSRLSEVVHATAQNARTTAGAVQGAQTTARGSGEIVSRAIDAMSEINRSSEKITAIIGVIDEIAFQTNLLALNAGVEAARAGDAGRGFAVVAQEVRQLAQRCASAAKEIKGLISESGAQVRDGVELVEQTGTALSDIIAQVDQVQSLIESISSSTSEQSTGIAEVTRAVGDVELITQRNAAMVEENNAEIQGLRDRVEALSAKIGQFRTGETVSAAGYRKSA